MDHGTGISTVRVWDPFVRLAHWGLVLLFAIAYFTEGEPEWLHSWSGYIIAGLVVLRIFWGFVGSRHARFSDFVTGPFTALRYLTDMVRGTGHRYIGHSPAGGLMTVALLLGLLATTGTGMVLLAIDEGRGPLAVLIASTGQRAPAAPGELSLTEDADEDERGESGAELWEEVHEVAANLTLLMAILHILGVAAASYAHGENLPRSMITGRKRV